MGQKFLPSKSLKPEEYFTYLRFSHMSRRSKVIVLQSSKMPPFLGFLSIHHIYTISSSQIRPVLVFSRPHIAGLDRIYPVGENRAPDRI